MVKNVQPVENGIVSRSNKLIEARYKLSLHEQKVIYSIISLIQPNQKELNRYRFKIAELAKFCGMNSKSAYRQMEEVTRSLLSRVLTVKDGRKTMQTHWVQSAVYESGVVEFELDEKLEPYLLELQGVFTSMKVSELMSFKSQYSGRIYELLYQFLVFGTRRFTLDEFKELLGLDTKEYGLFSNIKARIIESAVKDINKNTPMAVTYETEKTGKKITSIIFHMKYKPPKGEECLGSDMFDAQEEIKAAEKEDVATTSDADRRPAVMVEMIKVLGDEEAIALYEQYGEGYCFKNLEYSRTFAKSDLGAYYRRALAANWAKYINPNSEAAAVARKENPGKPNPDCPKCHGKGGYVGQVTGAAGIKDEWLSCDCKGISS